MLEARADDGNNFDSKDFMDSIQVKTGCGSILGCAVLRIAFRKSLYYGELRGPGQYQRGRLAFGVKSSPACSPCLTGQDFECNDFDSCTIDACIGQTCSYETDIACCEDEATWGPLDFEEGERLRGGLCRTP